MTSVFACLICAFAAFGVGYAWARRGRVAAPVPLPPAVPESGSREAALACLAPMADPIVILDARDRVAWANPPAMQHLLPEGDVIGSDVAVSVRSADFLEALRRFRRDTLPVSPPAEMVLRRGPRAPERVFDFTCGALPESAGFGPGAALILFADQTRLRRLEAVRREFVANVSHDLRTPVTIIKGYARTLAEDYAAMAEEDRLRFVEKIRRNSDRLHGLLESLLELAAAEGLPAPELKTGALHHAVREALDMLEGPLAAGGLAAVLDLGADESRVAVNVEATGRIVRNLLENALRYATGATRVRIITRDDPAAGCVILRVEDDGPGVPEAEYDKVFRRFYRTEKSRSLAHGGAGLGLSIVKRLVKIQGGDIRAEGVRPRGFAVEMRFPRLEEPGVA